MNETINIPEDQRVHEFRLLISDACENWFAMLPLNARDTYDRLRLSFEHEYCNPNANIAERELFYARRQQYGETAISYIECMIKLGNKLQIDANEIQRTARRGLLPDL